MCNLPAAFAVARLGGVALALALSVPGCSNPNLDAGANAGLACLDDSKECIDRRGDALRTMISDRNHGWVRQPATPAAYVSGVRLFAYKSRKQVLSCEDLAHGKREADAAPAALNAAAGASPAQISRSRMLAGEVSKELHAELKRRCRA
jgi:hypothetical protein